jgi:hypothetical protein
MERIGTHVRQAWTRSRAFRIILILALVYIVVRLAVHGAYLAVMLNPNGGMMGGMPDWTGAEGDPTVPVDLQIYLDAAERFSEGESLYLRSNRIEIYQYPPLYALAFMPFLRLSPVATVVVHSLLHVAAYGLLYVSWYQLFDHVALEKAREMMAWTLPVWLVFSPFWSDLGYLNVYVIMALLGTLFIAAILKERLMLSVLWLAVILQIKPHWAFAAIVPLLLGRYRFFLKLVGLTVISSAVLLGAAMLVGGPTYVWEQHVDYLQFLPHVVNDFPWRSPESSFLGYNHSIKQIVFYLLGVSWWSRRFVTGIKLLLLAPLSVVGWRSIRRSTGAPLWRVPELALDVTFVLYLGVFIWLDMVWEASLGIAIFTYLLATLEARQARILTWSVFLPYALLDAWQLTSLGLFGMDVIAPGLYVLTDPSIYVPIVMVVILVFYATLVRRLWDATSIGWETSIHSRACSGRASR